MELRIARTWDGAPVGDDEAVTVMLAADDHALTLRIDAPFHGDPPPAAAPGSTDGLWEHEVVELFVGGAAEPERYTEIELGPHGHHLGLRLDGVRRVVARGLPIEHAPRIAGGRWTATASIARSLLPEGPWVGNAYAIHGVGAARRYLAWRPVPGAKPDFHQPARFGPLNPR